MSEDPDEACSRCVKRKRPCLWDAAEHNSLVSRPNVSDPSF